MQKNLNFLCFGIGVDQEKLAKSSKKFNNNNIVIEHKNDQIKKNKNLIDELIFGSVYKYSNAKSYCNKINKINKINKKNIINDIIFRSSGPAIITAYKICKIFNIKRIDKNLAQCIYSKRFFFEYLKKKGILDDIQFRLNNIKKENIYYVIKPDAPLVGKKGVIKTANITKKKIRYISNLSDNKKVYVSQFIDGEDISVVFLKKKSNKDVQFVNFLKEINYFTKGGVLKNRGIIGYIKLDDRNTSEKIIGIAKKILENFKNYYGFIFISFRVKNFNIYPYEINIGLAGDNYAEKIFPYFFKNNIFDLEISNLMSKDVNLRHKKKRSFIGYFDNKKIFSKKDLLKIMTNK